MDTANDGSLNRHGGQADVVMPVRAVAYLTLLVGFALVDLVDPRNP